MKQIPIVDTSGEVVDYGVANEHELDGRLEENADGTFTVYTRPPEGMHHPVFNFDAGAFVEGLSDAEVLGRSKQIKLQELYNAYQAEKWSEIESSLVGADGRSIVFGYSKDNRSDYSAIANKFSLDASITESLIGTKSHEKIMISREDFVTFMREADQHESALYQKLKDKQTEVEEAIAIEEVKAITW